jgi:hypothetical protein
MNNPLRYTDPTGKYTCADDHNLCQTQNDRAFEAARQNDLQSTDKAVAGAAKAYGDPTNDNHVSVGFVSGDQGGTNFTYKTDGKTVSYQIDVTIPEDHVGVALDINVGHEGAHVGQDLAFASSLKPDGSFDATKNLTAYDAEKAAYRVDASIIQASGRALSIDPSGQYTVDPRDSQRRVDRTINRYLADPTNPYRGVTPSAPGPRLN